MTERMSMVASGDLECPTHAVRPVRPRLPRPRESGRMPSSPPGVER